MKDFFLIILFTITISYGFSIDIGGALSVDFYNNPILLSAASPIQNRPIVFHNLDIKIFNLRSGIGITEGYYEVREDNIPVFNEIYDGFYTLEFDIYTYPGIQLNLTDNFVLGLAVGGGVRLPVISKIDSDDVVTDEAFNWFYSDFHFLYWGAQIFTSIKLPLSEDTRFFGNIHYKDFVQRENQWIIGATVGLLWHFG